MALLAIERSNPPYAGSWALPGGFVDPYEIPVQACLRELREETGLAFSLAQAIPLTLRGVKGRDPRGWTLTQPFLFWIPEQAKIRAGDDAAKARWIPLNQVDHLAFDHGAILCEALGKFWSGMPGGAPSLASVSAFGAPADMPEPVSFFGGSFNPWHRGHLTCVEQATKHNHVIVVPDNNPFKARDRDQCFWHKFKALKQRLAMARVFVFPGFYGMEAANPTVSWFPYVRVKQKGFLMGDDSFAALPRWINAEQLVSAMHHLWVVPRDASTPEIKQTQQWLRDLDTNLAPVFLADHAYRSLSSTKLRHQVDKNP